MIRSMKVRAALPYVIAAMLIVIISCIGKLEDHFSGIVQLESSTEPTPAGDHEFTDASIYLPRGGPYILGFQSTSAAKLVIANHTIAGTGLVTDRIVLPAGEVDFHFEGPRYGARLVWHPPGRRGEPEYVPPSNLRSIEDDAFDPKVVGRSVQDGVFAVCMLTILVALGFWAMRKRLRVLPRGVLIAGVAIFALALCVRLYDIGGAGQTWDEDVNWSAGRNYITNIVHHDFAQRSWIWNLEHPPVMKYLAGIGAQFQDGFDVSRGISGGCVALACFFVVLIGARLYRPRVGILAGVIAALLPSLIAHGKVVGHEAPTALWWSLGVWLAITTFDRDVASETFAKLWPRLVGLGIVLGLAIFSRFINGLLGPAMVAILFLMAPREIRVRISAIASAVLPLVAIAVGFLIWPRLWSHPFAHLAESWARLNKPHGVEPFLGGITNHPPLWYFFVYLVATAPLGVVLAIIGWKFKLIGNLRGDSAAAIATRRSALVLATWFLVPIIVMFSPVRQDGIRYVIPSVIAMTVMAAAGIDAIASRFASRHVFTALAVVLTAYLAIVDARIHPYYLDYFAEQVGGPLHVTNAKWFETAWWGEGVDRAVDYVNQHAAPNAHVYRDCIEPMHLAWFRGDLWNTMVPRPDQAEWIVAYQPIAHPCAIPHDAKKVFTVDVQGAPLAEVWQRDVPGNAK